MIVRSPRNVLELLFACRGSIVPAILPQLVTAVLFGCAAVWLRKDGGTTFVFTPFTPLGVAISLFLGFRNNAAYDRWWEGRKQWGAQVVAVRNLGRLLSALNVSVDDRRALIRLSVAHSHALRAQLRATWRAGREHTRPSLWPTCCRRNTSRAAATQPATMPPADEQTELSPVRAAEPVRDILRQRDAQLEAAEQAAIGSLRNPADGILRLAADRVGTLRSGAAGEGGGGALDSYSRVAVTRHLDALAGVQAAAERIAGTPLPFAYQLLVHRTAYLYILLAPFAMAHDLGWYTPLFNALVAYTFFGLDELSGQLECPFGEDDHCLALDSVCRIIEVSAAEALGKASPELLKPDSNFNLM